MPVRSEAFWLGDLAMTVALASKEPDPRPLLKTTLREFLADQGHTELGRLLKSTLKETR